MSVGTLEAGVRNTDMDEDAQESLTLFREGLQSEKSAGSREEPQNYFPTIISLRAGRVSPK